MTPSPDQPDPPRQPDQASPGATPAVFTPLEEDILRELVGCEPASPSEVLAILDMDRRDFRRLWRRLCERGVVVRHNEGMYAVAGPCVREAVVGGR